MQQNTVVLLTQKWHYFESKAGGASQLQKRNYLMHEIKNNENKTVSKLNAI